MFVPIKGFEGRYEISSFGRVRSSFKNGGSKILKNYLGTWKYYSIHLGIKSRANLVHRLVALHFVENANPSIRIHVNHIDGDKTNNFATNLEWCDRSENINHAMRTGLCSGVSETSHWAKLSNSDVEKIIGLVEDCGRKQSEVAKLFSIHQCHVSRIVNNKRRKYG